MPLSFPSAAIDFSSLGREPAAAQPFVEGGASVAVGHFKRQ